MRRSRFAAAAIGAVAVSMATTGLIVSPAQASVDDCYWQGWLWFGTNPSSSGVTYANPGCDGMYAKGDINAPSHADSVRGQYYKDGAWVTSSIGWRYAGPTTIAHIVGNTTDGRKLRGQAQTVGNSFIVYD